jgi:hypothetical protein
MESNENRAAGTKTFGRTYEAFSFIRYSDSLYCKPCGGCELAADIFKAGVWVGALLVVGVIALVIWMVSKAGS